MVQLRKNIAKGSSLGGANSKMSGGGVKTPAGMKPGTGKKPMGPKIPSTKIPKGKC